MKENTNKMKKKIAHKIFATLTFIMSIAYFAYSIIKIDNFLTNINALSIPLLIFLISLRI